MKQALIFLALLLAFCGGILCSSCRSSQPAPARDLSRAEGTPLGHPVAEATRGGLDSVVVTPHRSLLDKVLRREPQADTYVGQSTIKAGKKSTINAYYAPATVTSTTTGKKGQSTTGDGATSTKVEKPNGPTATGAGDAVDNTKAGQRGGAAATAPGATATATTIKPPTPWLKYGLWLAGFGGAYWLLFGGGGALLLALVRRNKSTDTQS